MKGPGINVARTMPSAGHHWVFKYSPIILEPEAFAPTQSIGIGSCVTFTAEHQCHLGSCALGMRTHEQSYRQGNYVYI